MSSNLGTAKKPQAAVSTKSNDYDKLAGENALIIVMAFWAIFEDFKLFVKMLYRLVKFVEKHDGDVS